MSTVESVSLPLLPAGDQTDVSVEMLSPAELGIYQSRWVCTSPAGVPFGGGIQEFIRVFLWANFSFNGYRSHLVYYNG